MLNISPYSIKDKVDEKKYRSFSLFEEIKADKILKKLLLSFFLLFLAVAFLPWTQNIRGNGQVTALSPSQRPQELNSVIDGRIEEWYVQEGDYVEKGDTIIFIREIKDEYFDPRLLERTQAQIDAKRQSLGFYEEKIDALKSQVVAIDENRQLKLNQAKNYLRQAELQIQADSIDFEAAQTNLDIAEKQLQRQRELYDEGLKSLTDLEARTSKFQEALAKKISVESKLLSSRNKLLNAKIELNSIYNEYTDKLQKARSSLFETQSMLQNAEAEVVKMENQLTNYQMRFGMYYITAPQNGYITRAVSTGIGENIKAGESLVSIMPADIDYAVEMYIMPRDLPLFNVGNTVRLIFDGWPSIVFSGWPIVTYGTFGGEVVAIDRFISPNGKYRILIAQDPEEPEWPEALRVGGGANGLALLDIVPVWYEIWRQINGFPPNFYTPENTGASSDKNKLDSKDKK
ncbi:biotin attachment protein [Marivirga tractuosa]|uniref:Outer membrane efflux protein n=1 Tax=Marivirga tractuosa (strain ATCC 23168 / DSM 4126 / NBRC 15989 / NCIMB 1408 / VKM B-1430 / H-43) TaxID=643867 RepID=E4TKV5_MARTH|nr:HlyD family efflux transporter periplasmic adaptor subunit [Marivirga tractuosa]ADR22258.1 outer membrane efflux protein [Marivirga tractuosa DSM 4126]BDD13276.1 biotin attachment protein [Marivirga tractuosa]